MTAKAERLVWMANAKMPVPLQGVTQLLSAGWTTIVLSAFLIRTNVELMQYVRYDDKK